jgi:uncharacterized protein with FMN-binding domain
MKRLIAALSLTIAGLAFVLGFKTREVIPAVAADTTRPTTAAADTTTTSPVATNTTGTATTEVPTTTAGTGTTGGTVEATGPTVQSLYGPVQVQVVVTDGTLVDVVALQLPSGDQHNESISAYAGPLLEEMALNAQSADIDVVSGATFTSLAYAESLQAALDEAGM